MITWDWYYTIAGVVAVEVTYLMARYMHGDPIMRRRAYEQLWDYLLAWLAIAGIIAIYEDRQALTNAIASAFGIPAPRSLSLSYLDSILVLSAGKWLAFWVLVFIGQAVASSKFPVMSGVAKGVVDFLEKWVGMQLEAFQWYVIDLAILAVFTMFYEYSTKYGLFAIYASLMAPRSTRPIGATLTAYYVVISVMLPIMYGIVILEQPYIAPLSIASFKLCTPKNLFDFTCIEYDLQIIGEDFNTFLDLLAPYNAYKAFVYDALLDLAYVLTFAVAYWIARLIDVGASRLLEEIG